MGSMLHTQLIDYDVSGVERTRYVEITAWRRFHRNQSRARRGSSARMGFCGHKRDENSRGKDMQKHVPRI